MMEPDGRTKITFLPDTAAGIRSMLARLTVETPQQPNNWRPWHKHTLPKKKGKR